MKNLKIGGLVRLNPLDDEDLIEFLEERNNPRVIVDLIEDENFWGKIEGTNEEIPYHLEVKDICEFC